MPAKRGPFLEYLRGKVTATATVATLELKTPVSKTEELAMLIHQILINPAIPGFSAGTSSFTHHAVSKRSHSGDTSMPNLDNPDIIHRADMRCNEGLVVGAFSRDDAYGKFYRVFDPPILYAKDEIYFEAELGTTAIITEAAVQIGYTLEKVTKEAFIDALVE